MAVWKAQRTLLIVGEGYHEEAFLHHVKKLYAPRRCGLAVTIKNARGKGAKHVIDHTIRQIANAKFDAVASMFDTDTDWSSALEKRARQKKIQLLPSGPCFDALMLRLLGVNPQGDTRALKRLLAPYLNNDPTRPENYQRYFDQERLERGRVNEPTIDTLLKLFGL